VGASASDAEIIHFAGHANLVDGVPALLFESGSRTDALDAKKIESWRLRNNRLVMLAACNTGIGPGSEGDLPWGLVPAFLNAGAPALIVSLMKVDDDATARLSSGFYELLARGSSSKATALQKVQLRLLERERAAGRLQF
jgi:CHAT domain-containing protein